MNDYGRTDWYGTKIATAPCKAIQFKAPLLPSPPPTIIDKAGLVRISIALDWWSRIALRCSNREGNRGVNWKAYTAQAVSSASQ